MSTAETDFAPDSRAFFAKIPEPVHISRTDLFFEYFDITDSKRKESSAGS